MSTLTDLSAAMAATVAQAGAAVARVEARRRLPASGIVWSNDGLIITAHHVVQRDENIQVGLADGRTVPAALVGRDPTTDLALLRAAAGDLTPLPHSEAHQPAVGSLTLALGRPGRSVQATLGVVSALGDSWRTRMGGEIDRYLQTDVVMYPGFSGGPLVGADGRLLGLNTSGLAQGVSLALPVETLQRVANALLAHGRVQRGYLGVSTQRVKLPPALVEAVGQKTGLLVIAVEAGSPAEESGLTLGDTLIGLGETAVHTHDDLLTALSGDVIGQKVPLHIIRGGGTRTVNVKVTARP